MRVLSNSCENIKSLAFIVENKSLTLLQTPYDSESAKLLEFICDSQFSLAITCELLEILRDTALESFSRLESLILESSFSARRDLLSYYQTLIEFYDQNRVSLLVCILKYFVNN